MKADTPDCSDQVITQLAFNMVAANEKITNAPDGAGWKSNVDATAGGAFVPKPDSYTYGKFTDMGLTKVAISDYDSLDSKDWDIAFRRYVIRINSGSSGPSCVEAAVVSGQKYEDVAMVPPGLMYTPDNYFTSDCMLISDNSGLPSNPNTALKPFWTYTNCVKMTGAVFVLQLADGRHIKLIVDDYYSPAVQDQCDTTDMIPADNTGSAHYIIRWAYLQ